MKILHLIISAMTVVTANAVTYQEFYVQTTGSNLNAGSTNTDAATRTYASGNWDGTTGVFTVASGNPQTDGVTSGQFASVYANGSTFTGFVGRITGVTTSTITVSLTAKSGTIPTTGVGTVSLKVGGAWSGPSGASGFPFGWYSAAMTNSASDTVRINFKSATYNITAAIVHTLDGRTIFQGYGTSPGDEGKATLDGGTSGSYYTLLKFDAGAGDTDSTIADFIFQNNGASGSSTNAHGLHMNSGGFNAWRCVARNIAGNGFLHQGVGILANCEAYACNQANNTAQAGIATASGGAQVWQCISHHNTGSNADGFRVGSSSHFLNCISWANGRHGFNITAGSVRSIQQCDAYANGGAGINVTSTVKGGTVIENCNLIKNTGAGIDVNNALAAGVIANCGFGAGTAANTAGNVLENLALDLTASVNYASNSLPWSGADTGNFTISLAAAKNAGRGVFVQSDGGTTIGTPDIGAAFAADAGGGGGEASNLNTNNLTIGTLDIQ